MDQQQTCNGLGAIARLIPMEPFGRGVHDLSPYAPADDDFGHGDVICAGLEELSRHLKWVDDDYQSGHLDRLEARSRSIVMLADQLGLRRVGQVAADVAYCIDDPDEVALAATLSRLMRLMTQALDHAGGAISTF
ncbi:hypothetical protein OAN307_c04760 [Octadecabacter antarcticus 307]|uniref:Uncharacterized protein n=1 Tax=Octadecabacter antarcticus 307 TaxID=391626 RepID=M9R0N9_9RHOB|nr:hypothetical protein [Octadecabacter antarcticus]AGI66214.1 hypothetical protein OAN307_c04760 [Octadecabacter antarcticus 307]